MHDIVSGLIVGAITFLGQFWIAGRASGKNEEKIITNAKDIGDIKDEQIRQWSTIGDHGERIGRLEGQVRK